VHHILLQLLFSGVYTRLLALLQNTLYATLVVPAEQADLFMAFLSGRGAVKFKSILIFGPLSGKLPSKQDWRKSARTSANMGRVW
jgi:hypothetical protein